MTTFVSRITRGTVAAACVAAAVAAAGTSLLSGLLLRDAEDRRLLDAARVLADELDDASPAAVQAHVLDELEETRAMGLRFQVFDALGTRLAGDGSFAALGCESGQGLRRCGVPAPNGLRVFAVETEQNHTSLFAGAALLSTLLAAFAAAFAGRRLARVMVAPLVRLGERLSAVAPGSSATVELGPDDGLEELDLLRRRVLAVMAAFREALGQAERFAADAAHELRTPLTSVRAELELLAERAPQHAGELGRVQANAARLSEKVDRLLVLAQPPGRDGARAEPVSLRDVVEDVLATLAPAQRERLEVKLDADPVLSGDVRLLETLVSNALSNALKFGRRIGVLLSAGQGQAVLEVTDDGPGVAPAERTRVFEPFYRSADAQKQGVEGHGLGLALLAHIAKLHRGTAAFEDGATGARLVVRLPLSP